MLPRSKLSRLDLVRAGLWKNQDEAGLEHFELLASPEGWVLRGTILAMNHAEPAEARYQIRCDSTWKTESAEISLRIRGGEQELSVTVENGHWYENGQMKESVEGCIDIDLGWSPSTNTLPIRRLNLPIGESSGTITAAWISFPDLKLQPLPQEYERLADRRYLYISGGGSFKAELLVDEEGLVVNYDNFWRRLDRGSTNPKNQTS